MAVIEGRPGDGDMISEPPLGQLAVHLFAHGGGRTLRLVGELDMATVPQLTDAIEGMDIEGAEVVTLDLSRTEFMDSTGIRATLVLQEHCRAAATELRIIPGPRAVQRVFEVTGLITRLPFRQT
jgi:anti-sigma B factor antagonist